ncbi:hypothetical protein BaRGS_00027935 [Batillaria attramentaria]|uniref:Uncharacterized protein n=1 Tax=Batillaria attramentaria TaxID=370345 RepID=A0ABD0K121_9CAEN
MATPAFLVFPRRQTGNCLTSTNTAHTISGSFFRHCVAVFDCDAGKGLELCTGSNGVTGRFRNGRPGSNG